MSTPWHPRHAEPQLAGPLSGLIAVRDPADREPFILGIYIWRDGAWRSEQNDALIVHTEYWWASEDELLRGLP